MDIGRDGRVVPPPLSSQRLPHAPRARTPSGVDQTIDDEHLAKVPPAFPSAPAPPRTMPGNPDVPRTQYTPPVPQAMPLPTPVPRAAPSERPRSNPYITEPPPPSRESWSEPPARARLAPSLAEPETSWQSRGLLLVLLCFVLGAVIASGWAYKAGKIGGDADEERFVARATDAMFRNAFHEPPGENVKDITDEGLRRWPTTTSTSSTRAARRACRRARCGGRPTSSSPPSASAATAPSTSRSRRSSPPPSAPAPASGCSRRHRSCTAPPSGTRCSASSPAARSSSSRPTASTRATCSTPSSASGSRRCRSSATPSPDRSSTSSAAGRATCRRLRFLLSGGAVFSPGLKRAWVDVVPGPAHRRHPRLVRERPAGHPRRHRPGTVRAVGHDGGARARPHAAADAPATDDRLAGPDGARPPRLPGRPGQDGGDVPRRSTASATSWPATGPGVLPTAPSNCSAASR